MLKKYIISIEEEEAYPFDGPKPLFGLVVVRVAHSAPSDHLFPSLLRKLARVVSIRCQWLLPVLRVRQTRGHSLQIDYQYVPEPLSSSPRTSEQGFMSNARERLLEVGLALAEAGIRAEIKAQNIGVREDGEIRLYLGLNFHIVAQSQKAALTAEYPMVVDRLLQSSFSFGGLRARSETQQSQKSQRVDQRLNEMEGKLSRLKLRTASQENIRQRSKNIVMQGVSRESSNCSFSAQTSHSAIAHPQQKVHKSSFGDYSTSSCKLQDESLGKRVSHALQKTQEAFKIYEKYSRRKRK